MNTFDGMHRQFINRGVHVLVTEALEWRVQVTTRPERKALGGWNDDLNAFLMTGLEKLADTLENITYSPSKTPKPELEQQAADTARALKDDYDKQAINSDDLVMPPGRTYEVIYDLGGANADYPQPVLAEFPNAFFRDFVTGLDSFVTHCTRLTSRSLPSTISKNESAMMRRLLNELYTICQRKGGEANRRDMPTGTLPSQEPAAQGNASLTGRG